MARSSACQLFLLSLALILLIDVSYGSVHTSTAPVSNTAKVFMEYIGASGNPVTFGVPISSGVDFYYILGFAVDASPNGTVNNGHFVVDWADTLTPSAVLDVKSNFSNVKVMMSLCGWSIYNDSGLDQPIFWYEPKNRTEWLDNAFASISSIVTEYHLDGVDLDFENFNYPNNFSSIMGELIVRLKAEGVAKLITVAPFHEVIQPYIDLYKAYNSSIDYVLYQFYADGVPNATAYLATYNDLAKVFGYDKITPSYEIKGRGVQNAEWFNTLALIDKQNPIPGIMIFSADQSVALNYTFEVQSQALLVNGTLS